MRLLLATVFPLGLVAALNPCAFPLLPAYLARFCAVGAGEPGLAMRARRALLDGAAITVGFVGVFVLVGASASLVLHLVLEVVPGALVLVGAVLLAAAVLVALGRAPGLKLPAIRFRDGTGLLTALGFGVAYGAASLGCALPLFAAAAGEGAATAGWAGVLAAGAGYALGMGLLVTGVGLLVACCGAPVGRRLSRITRLSPLVGAALTGLTGFCLAFVGLRDLGMPAPPLLGAAQSTLASLLADSPALLGTVLGGVVVGWLVVVAVHEARRQEVRR